MLKFYCKNYSFTIFRKIPKYILSLLPSSLSAEGHAPRATSIELALRQQSLDNVGSIHIHIHIHSEHRHAQARTYNTPPSIVLYFDLSIFRAHWHACTACGETAR